MRTTEKILIIGKGVVTGGIGIVLLLLENLADSMPPSDYPQEWREAIDEAIVRKSYSELGRLT
jgi:hypothetical protein